jgi:hypothetical protein
MDVKECKVLVIQIDLILAIESSTFRPLDMIITSRLELASLDVYLL